LPGSLPGLEEIDPDLTIQVQKENQDGPYQDMMTAADLPLEVGDRLQFHVNLPEPRYVYLYWIDANGKADRFWPEPDADLGTQSAVTQLALPARADAGAQAQWYQVDKTGGPEVIFLGVSKEPLGQNDLHKFESHSDFLVRQLPAGKLLSEFEYPPHPENYVQIDGVDYRTRGVSRIPVVAPKTEAIGFGPLRDLFGEYHGWIFQTQIAADTTE
jgi:hypothetical protein